MDEDYDTNSGTNNLENVFDLNDNELDGSSSSNKESTGRWTKEEHQAFIKGLELYGKGWKKIAALIKTRTVVQIRTHAQKYFLKLSKARQNGELASFDGRFGFRRKKLRRKPIGVAPPLQPFISKNVDANEPSNASTQGEAGSADVNGEAIDINIDDSIYNFLSPNLLVPEKASNSSNNAGNSSSSNGLVVHKVLSTNDLAALQQQQQFQQALQPTVTRVRSNSASLDTEDPMNGGVSLVSILPPPIVDGEARKLLRNIEPPRWYSKGLSISKLLEDAEQLDWITESTSSSSLKSASSQNDSNSLLGKRKPESIGDSLNSNFYNNNYDNSELTNRDSSHAAEFIELDPECLELLHENLADENTEQLTEDSAPRNEVASISTKESDEVVA